MITRNDIAAHLERSARSGYLASKSTYQSLRAAFVREAPSDGAFEEYVDMGSTPWPVLNSGKGGSGGTDARTGAPVAGRTNAGGQITIWGGGELPLQVRNLDYEIGIGMSHNAINDDRAGNLVQWAMQARVTFEKHKDYLCFDALNNGEATTKYGACYDALSFFNDSHIDPGAVYQTGQDNKYAVALSNANFKTVKIAAAKVKGGDGQPVGMNHNLLIVPPDLEEEAAQITLNKEKSGTANRDLNPYAGSVRHLVAPGGWLDTTAWYIVDPNDIVKPLLLQIRQEPTLVIWDDESAGDGGARFFVWRARYNVAYASWRHCFQGNT
ncbi:MAG: hypothetical protein C4575_12895 [Desulforudis sp.]|jgi:phage major head subunit gpT-like protein|nr:MAG: hypothetical protein C4575_12895 [Desulforudis sp.]